MGTSWSQTSLENLRFGFTMTWRGVGVCWSEGVLAQESPQPPLPPPQEAGRGRVHQCCARWLSIEPVLVKMWKHCSMYIALQKHLSMCSSAATLLDVTSIISVSCSVRETEDAACLPRSYCAQPYCRLSLSIRPALISLRLKMNQALEDAKNHLLEYYEQHHFLEVTDGTKTLSDLPLLAAPRGKKSTKEFFHLVRNVPPVDCEAIAGAFADGTLNLAALPACPPA